MTSIRSTLSLLCLLAAALPAQTLSGEVVRNNNDTVTYTLDLYGPPNGIGFIYVSPFLSQSPLFLPPYGNLYLDPLAMVSFGSLPLSPIGTGRLPITVPAPVTNGLVLGFQSLFLDTQFTPRLSRNWTGMLHDELPRDVPESMVWSTDGGPGARAQFQGTSRFHKIVFRDASGAVLGECNLETTLPGNKTPMQALGLTRGLRKGDTYESWESGDGQQWTRNRSPRPIP